MYNGYKYAYMMMREKKIETAKAKEMGRHIRIPTDNGREKQKCYIHFERTKNR